MKLQKKVEVFVFRSGPLRYLLLKRIDSRGGFWQPVTGNVETGEDITSAAVREVMEETGILDFTRVVNTDYSFEFESGATKYLEVVFGVEVEESDIVLSGEHCDHGWFSYEKAIKTMIWDTNKRGLEKLHLGLKKT